MRVLIYLDPHPVRDSMVAQLHIGYYFARMFETACQVPGDWDWRLYGNDDVLTAIISRYPSAKDFCLMPVEAQQAVFQRNLVPWFDRGMQEWIALASGDGLAGEYYEILGDIYARFPFDLVVHWGTNGAVTRFCDENGLRRVTMGPGCARRPYSSTFVFDPNGVSGGASPSLVDLADIRTAVESQSSSAELDLMTFSGLGGANLYDARFDYDAVLDEQIIGMAAGRPIAFLPLPAHDDPSLRLYSEFSSPTEVVDHVLPQLTEAGFFCFVKPHPAMLTRPGGGVEHFRVRQAVHTSPNSFCVDGQMGAAAHVRFLELSDLLVTVNGSVGFEAVLHNKRVCVLGKAMYRPDNVFPSLEEVISYRIFEKDYDDDYKMKISFLRRFFLDAYLVPDNMAFDLATFTDRVRYLSGLKYSAVETVQSIYHQFGAAGRQQRLAQLDRLVRRSTPAKGEQDKLLASLQVRVSELQRSTSWRITRPLRRATALLSGSHYNDPRMPNSISEGIGMIENIMSSGSWAVSWPLRFANARLSAAIKRFRG